MIYFHGAADPEGQRTVVTETRGRLVDRRVVRGREDECAKHYKLTLEGRRRAIAGTAPDALGQRWASVGPARHTRSLGN